MEPCALALLISSMMLERISVLLVIVDVTPVMEHPIIHATHVTQLI